MYVLICFFIYKNEKKETLTGIRGYSQLDTQDATVSY